MLHEQANVEKERNMTVGKVQARSGKLPTLVELERFAATHPPPLPTGEVAVDERSVEELLVALAHVTKRAGEITAEIEMENQKVARWKVENRRRKHNYVRFICMPTCRLCPHMQTTNIEQTPKRPGLGCTRVGMVVSLCRRHWCEITQALDKR